MLSPLPSPKKRLMGLGDSMERINRHRYDNIDLTFHRVSNNCSSKKTIALQKKLAPSSKVHEGWSVSDLQQFVLDVKAILEMSGRYPKIDRDEEPDQGALGSRIEVDP